MRFDTTLPAAYWAPISSLEKWRKNPRRNEAAVPAVARSIRRFGFASPVVVWESRARIVAGHTRVLAMESLLKSEPNFTPRDAPAPGLVPVRFVEFTDEAEAAAYALADNKLSEVAEWDEALLGDVLQEIRALDKRLLGEIGFGRDDIDRLLREAGGVSVTEDPGAQLDKADELQAKWQTALGQLWEVPSATVKGRAHRLYCADSTKREDVERLMGGERAVLCAVDPPYLVDYDGTNHPQSFEREAAGKTNNKKWDAYVDPAASVEFFSAFIRNALDLALVDNPAFYQWHASRRQALVEEAWTRNGLFVHQQIIWVKARPILTRSHFMWQHEPCFYGWLRGKPPSLRPPLGGENTTVWSINQVGESDGLHATQKPVEIFARPISYHTRPGDICLEMFSGSGSQLVAAEQSGRICYAIELAAPFVAVGLERLAGMGLAPRLVT